MTILPNNYSMNFKKIILLVPMLSHVGTINAVEKSALALKKYLNYEIYLINVFGEFDYLTDIIILQF